MDFLLSYVHECFSCLPKKLLVIICIFCDKIIFFVSHYFPGSLRMSNHVLLHMCGLYNMSQAKSYIDLLTSIVLQVFGILGRCNGGIYGTAKINVFLVLHCGGTG